MKKHLFSAVSLVALLAGTAAPALAHETALRVEASAEVKAELKERREERQENRGEMKEQREEFRADMKERLSDLRMRRIKAWWDRAARRLSNIVERQRKLAARIEVRIDRLEKAGQDMADERAALASARAKIEVAAKSIVDASAKVDVIIKENEPKEAFRKLHELHKGIIGNIRSAHTALVRVLVSLRVEVGSDE